MIASNHRLLLLLLRSFLDDGYIFLLVGLTPSDRVIGTTLSVNSGKLISDDPLPLTILRLFQSARMELAVEVFAYFAFGKIIYFALDRLWIKPKIIVRSV